MSAYVVASLVVAGLIVFFGLGSCLGCFETHEERARERDRRLQLNETPAQTAARHAQEERDKAEQEAKAVKEKAERDQRFNPFNPLALAPLKV